MSEKLTLEVLANENVNFNEQFVEEAPESGSLKLEPGEILRIDEKVYRSWSGVAGCGDRSTIDKEIRKALNNWVAKKMFEHKDLRWVRYGNASSKVDVNRHKNPWTGVRKCNANTNIPCYIEFRKL